MPDWRYNVLSTSEAYINVDGELPQSPFAASYPRRADRSRPLHTCPYTTIFLGTRPTAPYRITQLQSENGDPYADAYSVDHSSNLTDTSSFACYEDCRTQFDNNTLLLKRDSSLSNERLDENLSLQLQKASGVFYVSTKTEPLHDEVQGNNLLPVEGSDSDALSSCTCDSFERCEFDCREFEPFSDTCCCDPLSDGVCSRSPKNVESPENFCDRVAVEEDQVSARSDMDGLDLDLFEPAHIDCNELRESGGNSSSVATTLCGILHVLPESTNEAVASAAGSVPPSWEPFYCVLQQDRRTLTAYTSEELAAPNNNGEYATRSLPRVRIDGASNIGNNGVRLRCWAAPPSITEEEAEDDIEEDAVSLRAIPSCQGKIFHIYTFIHAIYRRVA